MQATPSINTPDWCAEKARTRLICDLDGCLVASLEKMGASCFVRLCNRSYVCTWCVQVLRSPNFFSRGMEADRNVKVGGDVAVL